MDLAELSSLFRTLSEPTRIRLLVLLETEELIVAELAAITGLAQPRVSTHLSKLRELGMVRDRRAGVSTYYRFNSDLDPQHALLWQSLRTSVDDAMLRDDANRLPDVLSSRARNENWGDSVAGDMERHYSPGRTWEALARGAMHLVELGNVLDIASGNGVLAELLSHHARSILCVDANERAVLAARERLQGCKNASVVQGDMHALDLPDASFDQVLMMHALTYSDEPARALDEATRVLRNGGKLLAMTLNRHAHRVITEEFGHRNHGFTSKELAKLATKAGLSVISCEISSREKRPPHFEVLTLLAVKP